MTTKGTTLTREQAIEIAGLAAVEAVERENCEPTNRVGYSGACQGDALCEWSAVVEIDQERNLHAYYYTTNEQDAAIAECDGDGSVTDWEIEGYEVI